MINRSIKFWNSSHNCQCLSQANRSLRSTLSGKSAPGPCDSALLHLWFLCWPHCDRFKIFKATRGTASETCKICTFPWHSKWCHDISRWRRAKVGPQGCRSCHVTAIAWGNSATAVVEVGWCRLSGVILWSYYGKSPFLMGKLTTFRLGHLFL